MDAFTVLLIGGIVGMLVVLLIIGPNRTVIMPTTVNEDRDRGCAGPIGLVVFFVLLGLILLAGAGP